MTVGALFTELLNLSFAPYVGDTVVLALGGDDWIIGAGLSEDLYGMDGNDVIWGNGGNDQMSGGNGLDVLLGGLGAHLIDGGNGDDQILGGADAYVIAGGWGFDQIWAGPGGDLVDGGNGSNALDGGAGDDTLLINLNGNDNLAGGDDMDAFVFVAAVTGDKSVSDFDVANDNDVLDLTAGAVVSVTDDGTDTIIDMGGSTVTLEDFSGSDFGYPPGFSSVLEINMLSFGLYGHVAVLV